MREETNGDVIFMVIKWVMYTDYYIAVSNNMIIIRGAISFESKSLPRNLGIYPISSGYFKNGEIYYQIISENNWIKFVDHVAIGSGIRNIVASEVYINRNIMDANGIESTNYFYAITSGNVKISIYNYNPSGHTIWKNIDFSRATRKAAYHGSHIPNSSFLFVALYSYLNYEIAVVDYHKNTGEEILRLYFLPDLPSVMKGLNSLAYMALGYL